MKQVQNIDCGIELSVTQASLMFQMIKPTATKSRLVRPQILYLEFMIKRLFQMMRMSTRN